MINRDLNNIYYLSKTDAVNNETDYPEFRIFLAPSFPETTSRDPFIIKTSVQVSRKRSNPEVLIKF